MYTKEPYPSRTSGYGLLTIYFLSSRGLRLSKPGSRSRVLKLTINTSIIPFLSLTDKGVAHLVRIRVDRKVVPADRLPLRADSLSFRVDNLTIVFDKVPLRADSLSNIFDRFTLRFDKLSNRRTILSTRTTYAGG